MIWVVFGTHIILIKIALFLFAYHLCKRGNTEIICFIFVNRQNNMISDMSVLFQ